MYWLSILLTIIEWIIIFCLPDKYFGPRFFGTLILWQIPLAIAIGLSIAAYLRNLRVIFEEGALSLQLLLFFGVILITYIAFIFRTLWGDFDFEILFMFLFWLTLFLVIFGIWILLSFYKRLKNKEIIYAWLALFISLFTLMCFIPFNVAIREGSSEFGLWTNMRYIRNACDIYAQENQNQFPANLIELIRFSNITPANLVCPISGTEPMSNSMISSNQNSAILSDELDNHSDLVYLGKGLNSNNLSKEEGIILIYSKDIFWRHDCLIVFADGMVSNFPCSDLSKLLAQSDLLRHQLGM